MKHLTFLTADSYITVKTQAGVVKAKSREYTETLPGTQPKAKLGKVEVHRERASPVQLHEVIPAILGIIGFPEIHEPEIEPVPMPAKLVRTRHLTGKSIEHSRI